MILRRVLILDLNSAFFHSFQFPVKFSESISLALDCVQWRNFAWGYPWARDGWVPHWLRSALNKVQKLAHNACEPCGVGSRGPCKGLSGVQRQGPLVGVQGFAPGSSWFFSMQKQHFNANLYVTWSRGMSLLSGILILSYRLKEVTNSYVFHCF